MPSEKRYRAPVWCALALALSLAGISSSVDAAGLGRLTVQSALGQPLRAEVEITSVSADEAPTLGARMATQSAFRQANLEFNPALSALRFDLERRGEGSYVVKITSLRPVSEPYLDLLIELTWATGRVLREYTVLLDPPALRATPQVIAPVASAPQAPAPAAAPVAQAPAPAPAPAPEPTPLPARPTQPAPAVAPGPAAAAPSPAAPIAPDQPREYLVKRGDTAGEIALQTKAATVSLDQMLVAMVRANPEAFANGNMNRLFAGKTLVIPSSSEALAVDPTEARREVVAQSRDFAEYKSRLAQVAVAAPPAAAVAPPASTGSGQVTTQVEDKSAPAKAGDQLQIAKAEPSPAGGAPSATAKADEATARQRALKEQEERAAELKKTNEALAKALELQSKAGSQAQQAAGARQPEPGVSPPAAAPSREARVQEVTPQPATVAPAPAPTPAPPKAEPKKAAPPPPPPATPSFIEELLASPTTQIGLGILVAALLGLFGYNIYRRRRVEKTEEFQATGTGLRANSLFGSTGGQSVDTGATSTFNSSFIPAASQLDSNEVDPIAEADVYIAYGREEQAEDILKEALRLQPDRNSVRVKLLEIYSRRGDKASFNAMVDELRSRTGGAGEDWERAAKLGRAFDPANSAFAAAGAAETAFRGPTTELRLEPGTGTSRAGTLGGMTLPPSTTTFGGGGRAEPVFDLNTSELPTSAEAAPETKITADTVMQPDTRLTAETRMPADTRSSPPTTQAGPSTRFEATLPTDEAPAPAPSVARAGTIDPFGATTSGAIDFSALDFDLGGPRTTPPAATPAPEEFDFSLAPPPPPPAPPPVAPPAPTSYSGVKPPATAVGRSEIPDVDLSLPNTTVPSPPRPAPAPAAAPAAATASLEDSLSRPTLLGAVGALPDEQAPRLTSNTDQATVPLIDFDLGGPEAEVGGRRTETQSGSPMAAQMATKLDLARGYIDLGVKDGARELLEEVMRDGTREQRQSAVELMKAVEV